MARPDPSLLEGVVAREVLDAMRIASLALKRAGVRHVVVGGLAVGANGFPRATRDVDFLVGENYLVAPRFSDQGLFAGDGDVIVSAAPAAERLKGVLGQPFEPLLLCGTGRLFDGGSSGSERADPIGEAEYEAELRDSEEETLEGTNLESDPESEPEPEPELAPVSEKAGDSAA